MWTLTVLMLLTFVFAWRHWLECRADLVEFWSEIRDVLLFLWLYVYVCVCMCVCICVCMCVCICVCGGGRSLSLLWLHVFLSYTIIMCDTSSYIDMISEQELPAKLSHSCTSRGPQVLPSSNFLWLNFTYHDQSPWHGACMQCTHVYKLTYTSCNV